MQTASAAGFYGKLPCKGDFLQRRLAQEFVDAWDSWLQHCLSSSREQLQERWLDFYLTSPVWRFAVAEGVCGSGAYAGVMVPSVDRVGRYFPLTVAVQLNTEDCLLDLVSEAARKWFDSAESLLLGALEAHDLDLSWFDDQVLALGSPLGEADTAELSALRAAMQQTPLVGQPVAWQVPLQGVHSLQRAVNVFAGLELERTLRPLTIWWTDGSDAVGPRWLCDRGLPAPHGFAAMMAGNWQNVVPPEVRPEESVSLVAFQAAISRRVDALQSVYFVSRPDAGLWGVAAAQTVADLLHDVPAAGSLTVLVEQTVRALRSLRARVVDTAAVDTRAVVFLRHSSQCAVVCAGEVQAARVREREVTNIEGTPDVDSPVVHYDTLHNGDVWVLSGDLLFDKQRLATLPALFVGQSTVDDATLARLSRLLGLEADPPERDLPLMLLAALPG
jgi:type VI secretion system protein ImpM